MPALHEKDSNRNSKTSFRRKNTMTYEMMFLNLNQLSLALANMSTKYRTEVHIFGMEKTYLSRESSQSSRVTLAQNL